MARVRLACCLLAVSLWLPAQVKRSVDDLVSFVKASVHQDDKKVAEAVQQIKLANRLDPSIVEDLRRAGAGPKTVAALEKLAAASANLPPAAPAKAPSAGMAPPPEPAELARILEELKTNALAYTKNLPNYICAQRTRRHVDPTGTGDYRLADTIIEQLTFFEQKEQYKVVMVNNNPVTNNLQHDQLGGAKSSGEFGSILSTIFEPSTQTEFSWSRWARIGPRVLYVFRFRVKGPHYSIRHEGSKQTIHVGFHGEVFADRESKTVMRIKLDCDDIPADFPIQSVSLDLNYDTVEIGGKQFVLPLQSDVRSREGKFLSWNEVSYHSYHKYSSDASISFDTPDAPPVKK